MNKHYTNIQCDQDDEIFRHIFITWNITKMLNFIEDKQIQPQKISKKTYERFISDSQSVEKDKIDLVDLEKPIILIEYPKGYHMLIDGIHRIRKAKKNNADYIFAYILPFKYHSRFVIDEVAPSGLTTFEILTKEYELFKRK